MAAIDFPNSPTVGQTFVAPNGATYQWDGTLWKVVVGTYSAPACYNGVLVASFAPVVGAFATAISIGPIGLAGEKWRLDAGMMMSSIGFQDFNPIRLWDGTAVVGSVTVMYLGSNGGNTYAGLGAITTLLAPRTFSLQGSLAHAGQFVAGTWITAQKIA